MSHFGPALVYVMCLATSLTCAILLARSYLRQRVRLLLWVTIGFAALSLSNLFLVMDMLILPGIDLWAARQLAAGAAILLLLYSFIWETNRDG